MLLTFDDPSATGTIAMVNTVDIRKSDFSNIGFVNKTGTLPSNFQTIYCSLIENNDYKKVFIGTDKGLYYTSDITAGPTWSLANNNQLPRVQIFDIKQQTMSPWECYNSGQIYVATNGRGIWTNNDYYTAQSVVGVEEIVKSAHANNLKLFPNPTNDKVNISFRGYDDENITLQIMDINGRLVKAENYGKINNGDLTITLDVAELSAGMYIVNVNSDSGLRRVSKLIISK
jgi:hypothetical protein